jgi:hypothetical protein
MKLKVYLKSGNEFEVECESLRISRNLLDEAISYNIHRKDDRIIHLNRHCIEAVVEID